MDFCYSFSYVLFCSHRIFLSFSPLTFVKFLLINKDAVFTCSRFYLKAIDSHGTLYLHLGLVGMHSAAASIWAVTTFVYPSFGISLLDVS